MASVADLFQVGIPTLDRPFGLKLWPIFNKAFEYFLGYPADDFEFVPGKTPMSTLSETSIFIVIYYFVIFGGREAMRRREPFQLKAIFLVHNFVLTAVSALLLALFAEQMIPMVAREGIFHSICHHEGGWTQPLVVLYYVSVQSVILSRISPTRIGWKANSLFQLTYLTKYLELLDTVFLFMKKKPLSSSPSLSPT